MNLSICERLSLYLPIYHGLYLALYPTRQNSLLKFEEKYYFCNRFTEFYVEELECPKDLSILVRGYLPGLSLTSKQVMAIVNFYLSIKNDRSDSLMDGTGHRPHFR